MATKRTQKINDAITASQVCLIDGDGKNLGVLSLASAMAKAKESGLDLVEMSADADPPICKLLDFKRHKYILKKRKQAGKKQKKTSLKEMKLKPNIDIGDFNVKLKKIESFILKDGHKVKISVMFKGRELMYKNKGYELIKRILDHFGDKVKCDYEPKMEGRYVVVMISPASSK